MTMSEGWRVISTAPKDGTHVDLWVKGRCVSDVYWTFATDHTGKRIDNDPWDGWCHDVGRSSFNPYPDYVSGKPTHWRPLARGPKKSTDDAA